MEPMRLNSIYKKIGKHLSAPDETYLVVSVELQSLCVCRKEAVVDRYDCSTSQYGIGSRENSLRTPPGLHRINEKYGAGAPPDEFSGIARIRASTGTTARMVTISF